MAKKKYFDGKCKGCGRGMEMIREHSPSESVGIYKTYHCSYCGTYAYCYHNDVEPEEWIVPKIIEEQQKSMTIWTISIKTIHQDNIYCVNDESKIEPYIKECMKMIEDRYESVLYEIHWLMSDFAIIYKLDKKGEKIWTNGRKELATFGKIKRYMVH